MTKCAWFGSCQRVAETTRVHPILGEVPICITCNELVVYLESKKHDADRDPEWLDVKVRGEDMPTVKQFRIARQDGYWRYEITFMDGERLVGPPNGLGYTKPEDALSGAIAQVRVAAIRAKTARSDN